MFLLLNQSGASMVKEIFSILAVMLFSITALSGEQEKNEAIPAKRPDAQIDPAFKASLAKMTDKEVILAGGKANKRDKIDKAKILFEELISRKQRNKNIDTTLLAVAYFELGKISMYNYNNFSLAVSLLENALTYMNRSTLNPKHKANLLRELAAAYYRMHNYSKALTYSKQAINESKQVHGAKSPLTAIAIVSYAAVLHDMKQMPEAIKQLETAHKILSKHSGSQEIAASKRIAAILNEWKEEHSGKRPWSLNK